MATERSVEFRTFARERVYRFRAYMQSPLDDEKCREICENCYKLQYMIAALLSRGAVVKDYLLINQEDRNQFVERCAKDFQVDRAVSSIIVNIRNAREIDDPYHTLSKKGRGSLLPPFNWCSRIEK